MLNHPLQKFMPVTFTIILENPNENVSFGLQKGTVSKFTLEQLQQSKHGEDLTFEFTAEAKPHKNNCAIADFSGSFVQGPIDGRFVYINIGNYAGSLTEPWNRRLKVPLGDISMKMVSENNHFVSHVPGKGKDGTPNCATVKRFTGWKARLK